MRSNGFSGPSVNSWNFLIKTELQKPPLAAPGSWKAAVSAARTKSQQNKFYCSLYPFCSEVLTETPGRYATRVQATHCPRCFDVADPQKARTMLQGPRLVMTNQWTVAI